jgi:hypothetical protein
MMADDGRSTSRLRATDGRPARPQTVTRRSGEHNKRAGGPPYEAGVTASVPAVKRTISRGAYIRDAPPVLLSAPVAPRTRRPGFKARYAVVYDLAGPRVRLGVGWALLVAAAFSYPPTRLAAVAGLYAATAAWAAFQTLKAWWPEGHSASKWVAAAGAGALPLATSAFGVRGMGATLVAFVAVALAVAAFAGPTGQTGLANAGRLVSCGVWVGLASASVVLTLRYEIGAVITLVVLVSVYEASDYIIGSGASNSLEGPLAGIISMAVVTAIVAFLRVPPFRGVDAFAFGGMAAICCPLGQLVGSAVLPAAGARAPALRRLDSLLVLAPAWAWAVGWFVTHSG